MKAGMKWRIVIAVLLLALFVGASAVTFAQDSTGEPTPEEVTPESTAVVVVPTDAPNVIAVEDVTDIIDSMTPLTNQSATTGGLAIALVASLGLNVLLVVYLKRLADKLATLIPAEQVQAMQREILKTVTDFAQELTKMAVERFTEFASKTTNPFDDIAARVAQRLTEDKATLPIPPAPPDISVG